MLSCSKKIAEAFLKLNRSDICQGAHSDGRMSMTVSVDILVVLCLLLDKLLDVLDHNATAALCIQVLGTFVECCPQRVMLELQKPSSSWSSNSLENCLLTKLLSKICQDSERFMGRHLLVINVVDLCKPLVSKGVYSEGLCKMVMYIIGPLFLNHMTWKYEEKHEHWEITAKVFELSTIIVSNPDVSFIPLKAKVLGFLMNDGAFHSVLGRILSVNMTDMHGLYFNRFVEPLEIESFEEAVTKGFLLLHKCISSYFASITDIHSTSSPLEFMLLHHAPGATPLIGCVVSLTGYSKNEALQLAAIKMLTTLCIISGKARPHPLTISSYIQGDEQKESLQKLVEISLSKQSAEANIELYFHVIELMETAAKYQPSFLVMLLVPVKSPQTLEKQPHNLSAPENVCPSSTIEKLIWPILSQNCDYERQLEVVSRLLSLLKLLWEGGGEFSDILELLQKHVGFWTALTSYISNVRDNFTGLELSNHGFRYRCQTYALEIIAWELFLEREQIVYKTSCDDGKNVKEELKAGVKSALIQLLQAKDFVKVMQSLAVPQYDKSVITRAKAELKVMLVGLMMKVLKDDELGLSVSMFEFVREALKSVFCHSSFQKLVSTYLSQGYGHGQELYSLVISDLFFHLHGQLEAGRHIPGRLFEDLAQYLNTFDIGAVYRSETIYSEGSAYKESFVYDTQLLSQHLGLEWWEQTAAHFVQTASGALKAMDEANIMLSLGSCQIRVLNALQSIFSLLVSSNQMSFAGLESHAKDMYIISICESIESAFQLLLPEGDFTSYMQCFISAQLALLLVLLQWLSNSARADKVNIHVARLCSRVVVTLARAVRPISSLLVPENVVQQELIKNLLGAYLICLEILQAHKDTGEMQYSDSDNGNDLDHSTACDVTSTNVEFLQFMCLLIGNRCHTSVAISVLCVLMKHFLVPRIWIPIFQAHSTVGHALALLHLTKDTEIAFQVLNLLLCFSCVRSGVEMLQSAGAFSNILMFTENLNQDLMDTEIHAPFSAWKGRTRKHELWALALAVVAAFVQAIGENTGEQALDSAFAFLDSQKQHMLNALLSPGFSNLDRGKITRYGRSETTISALQETHQALHVLVLLVRYHTQWSHVMGSLEMDLQHKCIHLLAYIAREGLSRNVSASMRPSFFCYPITKDEFHSQLSVSSLNTTEGWFGVSAKGVCIRSILSGFNTSTDAGQSLILVSSAQAQSDVVPTAYSDSIALHVYKICLLLLELLCKQAHRAVIILNEGGPQNQISFPEFPAPEILHALEDQIVSVLKDLCGEKMRTTNKLLQSTCWLLLSILEKSLFIEALLSRMCGLGSLSVRSEDFWKDYKTLLSGKCLICESPFKE
ncbi:hypothetical protein KP509_17G079400 [Ceratopteris richardii]|uniref:Uncharacterized protein n=1 Tax=Ceratopteris richardii TaxID=49495 RepID=A0A8T2SX77_CERRI|nr:hypothetical protein KP509_17G079400 [Ceratopteris richardii]